MKKTKRCPKCWWTYTEDKRFCENTACMFETPYTNMELELLKPKDMPVWDYRVSRMIKVGLVPNVPLS